MKELIRQSIQRAIRRLYPEHSDVAFAVDYAPEEANADIASNIALVLAKKLNKKPAEVAEELAKEIVSSKFEVSVAKPGFMNFKLSKETLLENLKRINKEQDKYGSSNLGKNKLAIVEYFQLNVAKPPHVGHLRSAVIGDSLKRILKFVGYKTVSDTHIGDWGTQFGILLLAYKKLHQNKAIDLQVLNRLYVEINKQIEESPPLREEAKREFAKLEKGDEENRKLWKQFVDLNKQEFDRSAKILELLPFDYDLGESFYENKMPGLLKRLEEKHLLKTGEAGEKYVDLEKYSLGRLICVKSDGATTYEMRDLATLAYRYDEIVKKEKAELAWNLYVVDVRQSHDFKQVFQTMELLGYDVSRSKHVDHGFMSLPEGRISTRKGTVIFLEALLDEAKKRALEIVKEKNPGLKNKEQVAEIVGLGAVKYGDLKHNRRSDIIFKWEDALSFEGNTGPYLQYTYARLKSILRKSKGNKGDWGNREDMGKEEERLVRRLVRFPDVALDTINEFMPSILAAYLYDLAGQLNSFYHTSPVIQEKDEKLRALRIAIVMASANVLKMGLNLLGIEAPEEM